MGISAHFFFLMLSLVTTTCNRSKSLLRAAKSVVAQNFPSFQWIIFIDGWDVSYAPILEEITNLLESSSIQFKFVIQQENLGRATALNQAHKYVAFPFVGWLDDDDRLAPDCLSLAYQFLCDTSSDSIYTRYYCESGGKIFLPQKQIVSIPTASHFRLYSLEKYHLIGGVDPYFSSAIDYDFDLRLSIVSKTSFLPEPLYFYSVGSISSISGREASNQKKNVILSANFNHFRVKHDLPPNYLASSLVADFGLSFSQKSFLLSN